MPDQRKHRGPHPEDQALFGVDQLAGLRLAVRDLSWLFSHGYAATSALKLVGDRYAWTRASRGPAELETHKGLPCRFAARTVTTR